MSQAVELAGEMRRWEDLPGAVLSHLLQLAPYKRADVKLVCKAWRVAVNTAMTTVSLPAEDLDLLHQLTAVQVLTATTPASPADAQLAEQTHSAGQHSSHTPAGHAGHCVDSSASNPWASAHPATLQHLRILRLQGCPTAFAQLAEWQEQQMVQHTASSSDCVRPGLDSLQVLSLQDLGDVSGWLSVVLTGQDPLLSPCQDSTGASSSRVAAAKAWALQHLTQLQLHHCRLSGHGRDQAMLPQLPRLQSLELTSCHLTVLPAAVCDCTCLTQLSLGHNLIVRLPQAVSRLSKLQVLDLSSNSHLACLGSGVSSLGSLTELNLSGPNLLFRDHTDHSHFGTDTAAGAAGGSADPQHTHAVTAAHGDNPPTLQDSSELPILSHEQQRGLLPQLSALASLRKFSVAHNRDMRVLPSSLAGATQLEVLDASSCSLRFLDDEPWGCVGLRELLLGDNVLGLIGEEIGNLQQLEVLDIGRCYMLLRLPAALLSLRQLRRLVLATKAIDQGLVERLELRSPNPVDVEFDGHEEEDQMVELLTASDEADDLSSEITVGGADADDDDTGAAEGGGDLQGVPPELQEMTLGSVS